MKKLILIMLVFLCVMIIGCERDNDLDDQYQIALITDIGDIDDKSFNQGSWEGVLDFVDGTNYTYRYYKPADESTDAYTAAIDLAVANGAEIVITPGFLFEESINISQKQYPEVKFVLLDGNPANVDDGTLESNTYSISYAEDQAGYLAGYAAVMDGYRDLAFMGGVAVPAVVRFGHGFVLGADAAAVELDVDINIIYHYTDRFNASPEVQTTAATLYNGGTEVIFACGGAIGQSIMAAAVTSDKKVIGVDVDQSDDSETVITSAMKGLAASVYQALNAFYNDNWDSIGGTAVVLDASNDGVGLPIATSRFDNFTEQDYQTLFSLMASGDIDIVHEVEDATALDVSRTTITLQ